MTRPIPRISIGMPVYNGEPYLRETLDLILAQTFGDFELIISDNASTDRTEQICRAYAARDGRIRYFRNETNIGAAKNYNGAFALSSGAPYFKWAASDDLCAPEYLARCVEVLDSSPAVVLAYPKTKIIDEHGRIVCEYDDRSHLQAERASDRFKDLQRLLGLCNPVFGVIRSKALRRTALLGQFIGADICLLAELSLHGKFWEVPEYLFFRRDHPGASSADRDSIEKQMEFYDPARKQPIVLPQWRHYLAFLLCAWRAPLDVSERARLGLYLFRYGIWNREKLAAQLWDAAKQLTKKYLLPQ